ncbi:MAG: 23S rRNA (uracil(1939)-C(5))-methyltransferase RlmD [Firmicutes bacterium]|nr:23S rRNA (uracil(1939)-C(5))-methyltransferase RlmD [Bacillota bacterium]
MAERTPPVHPGETLELEVYGLGHAGEGVARYQNFALFIPWALPGDRIRARVTEVKKNFGRAALEAVLTPSPQRVEPRCPVYAECGGCQLQHLDYAAQLAAKREQVQNALARIGGLREVTVHPTLGMADPWRYRNKAQFPIGRQGDRVVAGFFAPGTHRIVDIDDCWIQHPVANRILREVKRLVVKYGVPVYDEATHTGVLRHVLVRVARSGRDAMAVLVTATPDLPYDHEIAGELMAAIPELVSLWQNINPERTNVILGAESVHLAGQEGLVDRIGDLEFLISPRSFYQVNPAQTEVLYRKALEYADLQGDEVVVDAYAGIGTISLFLARRARHVYGIEEVPEAVADARANAARNGIGNATFLQGRVEEWLPRLQAEGLRPEVIVFDPPRKGCEPEVLEAAAAMAPRRMVYVSCNPATLARDLGILARHGYRAVEVQPVDMFPHTHHVEAVARIDRSP